MRSPLASMAIVALAGLVVGWFGRDLFSTGTGPADPAGALALPLGTTPSGAAPVGLRVAGSRTPLAGAPVLADVQVEALRAFEAPVPVAADTQDPTAGTDGSLPALRSLATLYALAGRVDDFARVGLAYFERGGDGAMLLAALHGVPAPAAAAALDALLGLNPGAAFDAVALSAIYQRAGRRDRALDVLRGGLASASEFPMALLAELLRLAPEAVGELSRLAASAAWTGGQLAQLVEMVGEGGAAAVGALLIQRLRAEPSDRAALIALQQIDPAEAVTYARERVAAAPGDAWGWSFLGRTLKQLGDVPGAFAAMRESLRLSPTRDSLTGLVEIDAERAVAVIDGMLGELRDDEVIGGAGHAYVQAGRPQDALAMFERAHELDPNDGEWISGITNLDGKRAVAILTAMMSPDPLAFDDEKIGDLADAYRAAGDSRRAFDLYVAAYGKDPDDHEWVGSMIALDAAGSAPVFARRAEANLHDAGAQAAYGKALRALGRLDEAATYLTRAVDAEPSWAHELAAVNPDMAVAALQRRIATEPTNGSLWSYLASVYEQAGRPAQAQEAQARAAALGGSAEEVDWAESFEEEVELPLLPGRVIVR